MEIITSSPILSFMDFQKWIFIGIGVLITAIGTLFLSYKICQRNGQSDSKVSINIENTANSMNTSPTCPTTTLAHTGTNPSEHHPAQVKPVTESSLHAYSLHVVDDYATMDIDAILEKDDKDYTLSDRMALSRYSKRQKEVKN